MTGAGDETPEKVRPFMAHGADLRPGHGDAADWVGACPFCGKEEHFHVSPKKGLWDCKVCGESGNEVTFLTKRQAQYVQAMGRPERRKLSKHRGLPPAVLKRHGVGFSPELGLYMVPAVSDKGTVRDIRRYGLRKRKMMSTPGCKLQLWGADRLARAKAGTVVWVCEGEWDGMAMDWMLREAGLEEDVAVAVPGADSFKKEWAEKFAAMDVVAVYDNDDAGDKGAAKLYERLRHITKRLRFVHWPAARKTGYDTRDYALETVGAGAPAIEAMEGLMALVNDGPRKPAPGKGQGGGEDGDGQYRPELPPLVDMDFEEVAEVFADTIYMTDEMRLVLKLMLAVSLSNDVKSDPIWMYIVGPPGSGKTLLLTAFQGSERCVFRSTLTPASLVSGWKAENGSDPSLIPRLNGKTLVAKDFTEILDMPSIAQDEIFSTLRGAYDGHVQKSFGNGVSREYHDCHFSILAGVTHAIHGHRKAHLGERFLRFEMKDLTEDYMDNVLKAAIDSIGAEREMEVRLQHAVASFLQRAGTGAPPIGQAIKRRLQSLVKLIAIMRSQVERDPRTGEVSYRPRAELGTRLAKQLAKLGQMLAIVDGKEEADEATYDVLVRVAFDTVGGYPLDIVDALMRMGGRGTRSDVAEMINASQATLYRRFEDLETTGAIRKEQGGAGRAGGGRPAATYEVSAEVAGLWAASGGEGLWQKREGGSGRSGSSTSGSGLPSGSGSEGPASSLSRRRRPKRRERTRRRPRQSERGSSRP